MVERVLLNLKGKEDRIYEEIAKALDPHKHKESFNTEFIVEGGLDDPIIGVRYPGKKVQKRESKRENSAKWSNLYDFVVIIYKDGKEYTGDFTFEKILDDFYKNKRNNDKFWSLVEGIYYKNKLIEDPPELMGINSKLFLLAIKWIWIQEDLNYKFKSDDIKSPTKYVLLSKRGNTMSRGAGRAKFFAALILIRHNFSLEEVKKIIPLYA